MVSIKEDLLTDMVLFLKETLLSEALSVNANRQRLALLLKLSTYTKEAPSALSNHDSTSHHELSARPFSYIDLNGGSPRTKPRNEYDPNFAECYEELETNSEWSGTSSTFSRNYVNTSLYSSDNRTTTNRLSSSSRSDESRRNTNRTTDALYENAATYYVATASDICPQRLPSDRSASPTSSKYDESGTTGADVSLTMLRSSAVKFGHLYRKEKILFVEHIKKYWAGLLGTVLYIYNNEKDSKPSNVLNVDEYKARPINVTGNGNSKKDFGFEIVCPGKKTYQFYSSSKNEMDGWISCINHSLPVPQQMSYSVSQQLNHSSLSSGYSCPNIGVTNGVYKTNGSKVSGDVTATKYYERAGTTLERQLPSIPSASLYEHYDKPNPIIRPVLKKTANDTTDGRHEHETFYHSIEETTESGKTISYDYPSKKECYYNAPESVVSEHMDSVYYNTVPLNYCNNSNGDDMFVRNGLAEINGNAAIYDGVAEEEKENCNIGVGRIQQIIQQIEEISQKNSTSKKISPLSNRQSKLINHHITTAVQHPIRDEIYELVNNPLPNPIVVNGKA